MLCFARFFSRIPQMDSQVMFFLLPGNKYLYGFYYQIPREPHTFPASGVL